MNNLRVSMRMGGLLKLLLVAAGLAILVGATASLFDAPALRRDDDFGILWGSAYLHRTGGNPYSLRGSQPHPQGYRPRADPPGSRGAHVVCPICLCRALSLRPSTVSHRSRPLVLAQPDLPCGELRMDLETLCRFIFQDMDRMGVGVLLSQARTKLLIVFIMAYVIDLLGLLTYIFVYLYALRDFAQIWMPWILVLGYLLLAPHATPDHPNV
jgi:hypothetical protein